MKYLIITNNPKIKDNFENVRFFECSPLEILIKARDLLHRGYQLIGHPFPGNIKLMSSPYKSIVLSAKSKNINPSNIELMENSILKLTNLINTKGLDYNNTEDYQNMDLWLIENILQEQKVI